MSNDSKNLYGFNSSEITTTMMQNSQWGAVAYLAQSEYGNMQKSTDGESGIIHIMRDLLSLQLIHIRWKTTQLI